MAERPSLEYKDLYARLDEDEKNYRTSTIKLWDSIDFSQYETLKQAGYFILSRYMSGQTDELGRLKPFRQLSNGVVEIEFRAKNIDRAHISYKATDGDYGFALAVRKELQEWMEVSDFGTYIDDYQRKKAQFGTTITKVNEYDDSLTFTVCDWQNLIVNPRDIKNGDIAEDREMTLRELEDMRGKWDDVDKAIDAAKCEKYDKNGKAVTVRDGQGYFRASYFTGDEKDTDIKLYYFICAVINEKKYLMHYHELKKPVYVVSRPRKKIEGRSLGMGIIEELFNPQIFTNESVIAEKFAMDIAGKVITATNKKTPIPSALQLLDGEIIEIDKQAGEYFEPIALGAGVNFPEFQKQIDNWFNITQFDQSITDALRGESSSAPFAAQALQSAQSSSIFNKRRDNDSFDLIDIINDYVFPHIANKIAKEHKLSVSFSQTEAQWLAEAIGEKKKADALLSSPLDDLIEMGVPQDEPVEVKSDALLHIPKGYITVEKINAKGRLYITNEQSDDQQLINTLLMKFNNLAPEDPGREDIVNQIMELAGVSPASFARKTGGGVVKAKTQPKSATESTIESALPEGQV
jgi:hypothetical protein